MPESIIQTEYAQIMQKSYINYAMSVIVSRALPDVRDGLKPVQRRTLYDMYELGIRHDRPYRKCARIVGDTMGKYHPHGDSSIYDALVVMAQEFKKGLPLVDGHGNFGSIEGDGAAAMRYTEARLSKVTQEAYLADLDKNVVDFLPNFDETEREPAVLPSKIPNLLVNGAEGIAVGMATSIPPHNLGEVLDGVAAYMKNPQITTRELMAYIQGPDFPTGGVVANREDLEELYETGKGKIRIRGKAHIEEEKGKQRIVISQIPFTMIGANIGKFLNDIYALAEERKPGDIADISNQSSKEGIRIVIELRRGANAQNILNMLYKKTKLEDTFGVNMLAVCDGKPKVLGLRDIIHHHVAFQYEVNNRKYRTLLDRELEKSEIQEGLIRACDVIDLIIEILRGSRDIKDARACLVSGDTGNITFKTERSRKQAAKLHFTEKQAAAILEMRLYKLIGLELEALAKEHEATLKNIQQYRTLLEDQGAMAKAIIKELAALKKEYQRPRRTAVEDVEEAVFTEEEVQERQIVFLMDRLGYVKAMEQPVFEKNEEAARGESRWVIPCMSHQRLIIFTDTGKQYMVKSGDVPLKKLREKGVPVDHLSNCDSRREKILYVGVLPELAGEMLLFATKMGMVKQVPGSEFDVGRKTVQAAKLAEGDKLVCIAPIRAGESIVMQSKHGYFLRFGAGEVPEQRKTALGVRGMKLADQDEIEEMYVLGEGEERFVEYSGKQVALHKIRVAKRDAKGVKR